MEQPDHVIAVRAGKEPSVMLSDGKAPAICLGRAGFIRRAWGSRIKVARLPGSQPVTNVKLESAIRAIARRR
jgi:hypothetical protein